MHSHLSLVVLRFSLILREPHLMQLDSNATALAPQLVWASAEESLGLLSPDQQCARSTLASSPDQPFDIPSPPMFVTFLNADGSMRGCIGSLEPPPNTLGREIEKQTHNAAFADSRFAPISADELLHSGLSVKVLPPLSSSTSMFALN